MDNITSLNFQTKNIKAVIFDMDGVLVNTSPCHELAYQKTWLNWDIDGPGYAKIAGRSTREVIAEYCAELSLTKQKECVVFKQQVALELLKSEDIVFDDTSEVLDMLVKNKFRLALATSASLAGAELVLKRLQAESLFDRVVTAEDAENAKPAPDLFIKAIDLMHLKPEQTLVIEDSEAGIQAGLSAGSWVASVREASTQAIKIKHARYVGHFNDLQEMYQHLFMLRI